MSSKARVFSRYAGCAMLAAFITASCQSRMEVQANNPIDRNTPTLQAQTVLIKSAADLINVSRNLSGSYRLDSDIDLSGVRGWRPIGMDRTSRERVSAFAGRFDGAGHRINGLRLKSDARLVGLFGIIGSGASVTDFTMDGVEFEYGYSGKGADSGSDLSGRFGIIAAQNEGGTISGVRVEGRIRILGSGIIAGGLVGENSGVIEDCSSNEDISAQISGSLSAAKGKFTVLGGLVGQNRGLIDRSASQGSISVEISAEVLSGASGGTDVGGLVGRSNQGGRIVRSTADCKIAARFSGASIGTSEDGRPSRYWNLVGGLVGDADGPGDFVDCTAVSDMDIYCASDTREGGWSNITSGGFVAVCGIVELTGARADGDSPTLSGDRAFCRMNARTEHSALYSGGFSGFFRGRLSRSSAQGSIRATGGNFNMIGGLVAQAGDSGDNVNSGMVVDYSSGDSIEACRSDVAIFSLDTGIGHDIGGLAGVNGIVIRDCIAAGDIDSRLAIDVPINSLKFEAATIGGLVGYNHGLVEGCHSSGRVKGSFQGSVTGADCAYNDMVGGLIGAALGPVLRSFSTGDLEVVSDIARLQGGWGARMVGGLIGCRGSMEGKEYRLSDCYSTSNVKVSVIEDDNFVGGLIGYNDSRISCSYASGSLQTIGGVDKGIGRIVGRNDSNGKIETSFWFSGTAGPSTAVGSGERGDAVAWAEPPAYLPTGFDPAIWYLKTDVPGFPLLNAQVLESTR